jgi:hypothetical protein
MAEAVEPFAALLELLGDTLVGQSAQPWRILSGSRAVLYSCYLMWRRTDQYRAGT